MCKKKRNIVEIENERVNRDIQRIHDSYEETEKAFKEWKEKVLTFEHFEHCADDDPDVDDWVCGGECVRTSEDENDI